MRPSGIASPSCFSSPNCAGCLSPNTSPQGQLPPSSGLRWLRQADAAGGAPGGAGRRRRVCRARGGRGGWWKRPVDFPILKVVPYIGEESWQSILEDYSSLGYGYYDYLREESHAFISGSH